ncbi:hypothetical protein HPB52_016122 [Rhipicephalus sanguineus]|uniref:Uncharacterized protein n=1 Tax=Rhipicephalus sanguineus TaxID=34632 RepID=A0A9D4Q0V5_RHISA|nr:hypothetical protein HPB52_016122 [Rhipicephalus sanguineus]
MLFAIASSVVTYPQATGSQSAPDALALNSVSRALTCLESRGSRRPLVALTPERLLQLHVLLRRVRHVTGSRLRERVVLTVLVHCRCRSRRVSSTSGVQVLPIFGKGAGCRCLFGFAGDRCDVYPGRCWLMHCFLRDCYSARGARLRCVCDRALYGTRVLSGLYWYNDGLQGAYKPPPPSWVDVVPMQFDDDLEAYAMDGVDDEIDLTLYQQAVGAATSSGKPGATVVRESSPRESSSNDTPDQTRTKGIAYNKSTSPVTFSGGASWVPLGTGLLNKTLRLLPKYELPRIAKGARLLGQVVLMRNASTKSTTSKLPGPEREIAARNVKSTLEKDFGGDAKFVYEDYAAFDEGAMPGLSQSSAMNALGSSWPLWVVACRYVRRSWQQDL